jgi:hypothetical protein
MQKTSVEAHADAIVDIESHLGVVPGQMQRVEIGEPAFPRLAFTFIGRSAINSLKFFPVAGVTRGARFRSFASHCYRERLRARF